LAACELRAQLPGYRSSRQKLIGMEIALVNNVGPIVVYPINRSRGTTVSASSMLAPKAAKRLMEQAQKAHQQKKLDVFESSLRSAVAAYPNYGEAWLQLGQFYRKQKRYAEAGEALKKAVAVDELYVNPYVELGWLAAGERKWQEAADVTEKAVALDAVAFPEAYYLNALANFNMDKLDVAEKSARQARQLDPSIHLPHVFLILAAISAEKNDTSSAIEGYRNYLLHSPDAPDADSARKQLQELEDLAKAQTQK
jgi:tetratricopeptide (TPR) repeat protein